MSREENEINELTLLGNTGVKYPTDYAPEMLETFELSLIHISEPTRP